MVPLPSLPAPAKALFLLLTLLPSPSVTAAPSGASSVFRPGLPPKLKGSERGTGLRNDARGRGAQGKVSRYCDADRIPALADVFSSLSQQLLRLLEDGNPSSLSFPVPAMVAFVFIVAVAVAAPAAMRRHGPSKKKEGGAEAPAIKRVPGALPLVGNPLGRGGPESFPDRVREWVAEHGRGEDYLACNLFGSRFVITCSNRAMDFVARHRPSGRVRRAAAMREAVNSVGATGLFTADEGVAWAHDRRLIGPAMNRRSLQQDYLPVIRLVAGRLVEKWRAQMASSASITVKNDVQSFSIDIISLMTNNFDTDCLRDPSSSEADDIMTFFQKAGVRALSPIRYWRIPIVGQYLDGYGWTMNRIKKLMYHFIRSEQQRQQQNQSEGERKGERSSLLAKMVAMQVDGGMGRKEKGDGRAIEKNHRAMTPERLYGNLLTMFAAGSETISSMFCRCLWELVNDGTGLLQELVDEARAIGDDSFLDGASMETYQKYLPRMRSLFYEVNRMYAVVPFLILESSVELRDEVCGSVVFPPGTNFILAYSCVASQDPACGIPLGPKGEPRSEFCPRRWLVEAGGGDGEDCWPTGVGVLKPSAGTGVPLASGFGTGPRICPGRDLAELEVLVLLASLLRAFDVSLEEDHPPVNFVMRTTIAPDADIRLVLSEAAPSS